MKNIVLEKEELQVIVFRIGQEDFAVPIEFIQEIILNQNITHISKMPSFLEGVINLRGNVIPVVDGRKRFDLEASEDCDEHRIIVLELENHIMGLTVDSVSEVVHLNTSEIEPPPIDAENINYVMGIGKVEDKLIILLDPSSFLDLKETKSITTLTA